MHLVPVWPCGFLCRCTELDWPCLFMWNGFSDTSILSSCVFGGVSTCFWPAGGVGVASDTSVPSKSSSEATCIPNILLSKEVDLVLSMSSGRDIGELPSNRNGRVCRRSWNWSSHFWLSSTALSSKKSWTSFMNLDKCKLMYVVQYVKQLWYNQLCIELCIKTAHYTTIILLYTSCFWSLGIVVHVLSYMYVKLLQSVVYVIVITCLVGVYRKYTK